MTTKERKVLVTGGAGYIGSVVVGHLLQQGHRVRVLDNLTFGGTSLLPFFSHPNFEFHYGDIRQTADVDAALENVDAVIHLAAIVGDKACRENPQLAKEVNGKAAERLSERALARRIERFIFASTCSNYGKTAESDAFVDETSPLNPISLYAELKVGFEQFLLAMHDEHFTPTCLRFATAYGLSGRPRFDLTVNEFTKELFLDRKLEIYGEQFWRPYCHTLDIARACCAVLEAEPELVANEAFNVGDTLENFQKKRLVERILEELPSKRDNVVYIHKEEDPRDYRVNCDKIKNRLGFSITRRVPDGIREIIAALKTGMIPDPDNPRYRNA